MRWARGHKSDNVVDRRGGRGKAGIGIGAVLLLLVGAYFGVDLRPLLSDSGGASSHPGEAIQPSQDDERDKVEFVSFVLDDLQSTWTDMFTAQGLTYTPATLTLFRRGTPSGCGYGSSAIGPFYCPPDHGVFIDLEFFHQLDTRFGAPGDFAQAYVIAHEIGHHVQTLTGTSAKVHAEKARNKTEKNRLSVLQELQADCYAGVWGHSTLKRNLLEEGDVEEGLRAAAAIGDDTLQKQAKGQVTPETFTHGSSKQRVEWFRRGFESGTMDVCDTFTAEAP